MKRLLLACLMLVACKKKGGYNTDALPPPLVSGVCHQEVTAYLPDGVVQGTEWCKYNGYWWSCNVRSSFRPACHRNEKLPAEAQ